VDANAITDMQFELHGKNVPKDHGYLLFLELLRLMPWLTDEEQLGIHPIQGADTGQGQLILNRRTKLVIRTPRERVGQLEALCGKTIEINGETLTIGPSKLRSLTFHTPLYAHCVTTGSADEREFTRDVIRILDDLGIDSRFICGRRQIIHTETGDVSGYSLMLHGLPVEHAIRVQQIGIGGNRKLGCGIFIPHKSIQALT